MRIAAWVFVLATLLGAIGVFVPAVELRVAGVALAKKTSLSLYQASNDRDLVRQFIASYGKNRRYGAAIVGALGNRGRASDVHDAMDTLDGVHDDDIVSGARAFKIALWAFVALQAIMGLVMFGNVMQSVYSRKSLIIAGACSVLVTCASIAIWWACGEAVFEANDEIGVDLAGTSIGAMLIPIAAVVGLGAMIAMVVMAIRTRRGT